MDNVVLECPICLRKFDEPIIASDGFTYDLECLRKWYLKHQNSPMTKNDISKYVFRNMTICQLLNLVIPRNETFDLTMETKWTSPFQRLAPDVIYEQRVIRDDEFEAQICENPSRIKIFFYSVMIMALIFLYIIYPIFGFWGFIISLSIYTLFSAYQIFYVESV